MPKWEEDFRAKCYEIIKNYPKEGGKVEIQFLPRGYKGQCNLVPIIRFFPDNQTICDSVKVNGNGNSK